MNCVHEASQSLHYLELWTHLIHCIGFTPQPNKQLMKNIALLNLDQTFLSTTCLINTMDTFKEDNYYYCYIQQFFFFSLSLFFGCTLESLLLHTDFHLEWDCYYRFLTLQWLLLEHGSSGQQETQWLQSAHGFSCICGMLDLPGPGFKTKSTGRSPSFHCGTREVQKQYYSS